MKKSVLAAAIGCTTIFLGVACLSGLGMSNLLGNADATNLTMTNGEKFVLSDNVLTLKASGGSEVKFNTSGVTLTNEGTTLTFANNAYLENVDPIQSITGITLAGKSGATNLDALTEDAFKVNIGYVNDAVDYTNGKTMVEKDYLIKDSFASVDTPSYFKMTALKEVVLDKLTINYSCLNNGTHVVMPDKFKSFDVTIADGAKDTFKDGSSVKTLAYGTKLTEADFTTNADGRKIVGLIADDKYVTLKDFKVSQATTILPVYDNTNGYTRLTLYENNTVGGSDSSKFNGDGTYGSFVGMGHKNYLGRDAITLDKGYPEVGTRIATNKAVAANSTLRMDIHDNNAPKQGGILEHRLVIKNNTVNNINLDAYVINSSGEFRGDNPVFETKRFRMDFDLLPGETKEVIGQYDYGTNSGGNRMLYLVADKDMATFDISFNLSNKLRSDLSKVETTAPEEVAKYHITLDLGDEFTLKTPTNFKSEYNRDEIVTLPALDQIVSKSGKKVGGYMNTTDGSILSGTTYKFTHTKGDAHLVPILDSIRIGHHADHPSYASIDGETEGVVRGDFTVSSKMVQGVSVTNVSHKATLKANSAFRMASKFAVTAGEHVFEYHITNNGETDLSIRVINVHGLMDIAEGSASNALTIKPGETGIATVTITYSKGNGNLLPIFQVLKDTTNLNISISGFNLK